MSATPAAHNIQAWLDLIAACEGTNTPDGYRALFGYHPIYRPTRLFDNGFRQHPNIRFQFTQTDGTINYTTAAGRYQFIFKTWLGVSTKLALPDFSPLSQDLAAIELTTERDALIDVQLGDIQTAIDKCAAEWASLPSSKYPQPKRTIEFARNAFTQAGGMLA